MTIGFARIAFFTLAVLVAGWLQPVAAWMHQGRAQSATTGSRQMVEVPVSELTEIQDELRYLRARDIERKTWEQEVNSRLWTNDFDFASQQTAAEGQGECQLQTQNAFQPAECCMAPSGCQCECCDCYSCQCPLPPAPCLQCPHVSTLNPYFNIHVFGAVKLDMLFNGARPVAPGVPFFLAPGSPTGLNQNTVDIHARQTTLGAALTGPKIGSLQSGAVLVAMLFNDSVIADQYGFLPLQAFGELKNQDWRFSAGLQFDVFAPGIPTVLPFSALAASGNAGNSFRGSLRLEHYLHQADDVQWTFQGALSDPITTTIDPTFRINEDNGWPNVESRIALGLGMVEGTGLAAKRPFEVGISGVIGQIRTTPPPAAPGTRVVADVWGLATDFRWKVNDYFGFMGELYTGQALGTYNGGILQTTNAQTLQAIRSSGGWLEGFLYWTPCLHSHTGYGVDNPIDDDVATLPLALGRTFNSTIYSNLIWDLNQSFRIGFEFTWRETEYRAAANPNNRGAGFHTQVQWAF